MGTRTRLFASAAFPFLSLSLVLQPAHAALIQTGNGGAGPAAAERGASIQIAQAAPEPGDGEQDPRKRKKPQGEEQGQPPQKGEGGQQQKPAEQQQHEKPAEQQKQQPEAEAPKPPKPAAETPAPSAAEPEAPKPPKHEKHQPNPDANQPAAEPAAPKPNPNAAEPPSAPVKPKAAAEPAAPAAEPEAQPQGNKRHKNDAKAQQPETQAAPDAAQPAAPAAEPGAAPTKHHQKPANGQVEPAQPGAEPAATPAPAEAPAKPPKPAAPNAAEAPAQPAPAAEAPVAPKAPVEKLVKPGADAQKPAAAEQPAPAAPGGKPAEAAPAQKAAPAAQGENPAPVAPPVPAVPGKEPPAPAQSGQAVPQAAPSTAGEQVSPAELERRKKIAENPAAAGAGAGPVILPVQNGTAVLDSDKDAARRGHGGQPGAGQPADGGQMQAVPGQAPGGQRPPAPENVRAPTSDADSQRMPDGKRPPPVKIEAVTSEQGRRMNQRPDFASPDGARIEDRQDSRVIINFGDDVYVRHDDTQRFTRDGERPSYEQLPRDRYRETIDRPDGTRIITIRNRYGDIIQRSRVDQDGREYVLFYSPELEDRPNQDNYYRDPGDELPPMRLRIPLNQYIIDTSNDQDQDYYDFLRKPPVEPVERVYSLNEVRYSARIRDKVRRIDLDTITFATGSADIPMAQAKTLRGIADAIGNIVKKDPSETFLIEGHTDAVGSAQSNLILSDQRAESVANVLSDVYGIPPENLATQGYGEQYLKVNTQGPEQENRRVTIRRVTALVRPVAAK